MDRVTDQLCGQWEQAWQAGQPISIESLLQRDNVTDRAGLLGELIRLEVEARRSAVQAPTREEFRQRFPQHVAIVESAFAEVAGAKAPVDLPVVSEVSISPGDATVDFSGDAINGRGETVVASGSRGPGHQSIGRYTILAMLGKGEQADVFRGVHPTLPIEVAIKRAHKSLPEQARVALRQEAQILCDLDHPHIARVRDYDFDDGHPFLVLDFIRGRSLGQIARLHPLSPEQAAQLVAKLARAMGHAHSRGVIHRDLKPDNVVIDESGQPKIIDFGVSRLRTGIAGATEEPDEVSGTLSYMAPEQAIGVMSETDHRVDVFALGAILYHLLVGQAPYPPKLSAARIRQVREGDWDRDSLDAAAGVPERLKAICRQAMHREPGQRFGTAEEMAGTLETFVSELTRSRDATRLPEQAVSGMHVFSNDTLQSSRTRKFWQFSASGFGCAVTLSIGTSLLIILPGYMMLFPAKKVENTAGVLFPQASIDTSAVPISEMIRRFDIVHIGNEADRAEFRGGSLEFRPPRENDDIQVQAEFTEPAYCFLVALNPDGVNQLCYPSASDIPQPAPITRLRYPEDEDAAFGLTHGAGQQAFVLFASREPLPAYDVWESELATTAWPDPEVKGNWAYSMGELYELGAITRRPRTTERPTQIPTPFKALCDRLRQQESADVRGVIFEIQPMSGL